MEKWREIEKTSGMAIMTLNHYLAAIKTFCNWLVEEKRLSENPLARILKLNAATDRRRERRSFTIEELGKILAAAESGSETHGMTGAIRALLYRTATETGLRWSELRSLTRASFDFTTDTATITIKAEDAKNRKNDTLPLRPDLASDLKAHMALFLPNAKAFPGMGNRGAKMLQVDLKATSVPYIDKYGRYGDFHAFRQTYGTLGAKAGILLATMQKLMRHSDPKLTANLYTHILVNDKAEELAKLPTIAAAVKEEQEAATGTCDTIQKSNKIVVTKIDSFGMDSTANIKTYVDSGKNENGSITVSPETKKPLAEQGVKVGGERGIQMQS